jgi:hypothetical protein
MLISIRIWKFTIQKRTLYTMLFTVAKKFQHTENTAAKLLHMQNMQTQIHMHLFNCLSYNGTNNNHDSKHDEFRCSDTIKQNQVVFGSSKSN